MEHRSPIVRLRAPLLVLLVISLVLRVWLAAKGGQNWWPDETRFGISLDTVYRLRDGHPFEALQILFSNAEHLGFKVIGVIPAIGVVAGLPGWTAAAFFGLFSVAVIYLVGPIARATGGDEETALWASFFAAVSVTLFYYSRHYFPYDPALFFVLCSLLAGLRGRGPGMLVFAGALAGAAFVIYNGYWLSAGLAVAFGAILPAQGNVRAMVVRCVSAGIGLLLVPAAAVLIGRIAGTDLIASYIRFAGTVTLGAFEESWTFPWEFFWHAEGWLLVLWMVALACALTGLARSHRRYLYIWCAWVIAAYIGLGVMGAVLHKFVVYGRICRSLTPIFALICAGVVTDLRRQGTVGRRVQAAVALLAVVIAVPRFARPLRQWWPADFYARAEQIEREHPGDFVRVLHAHLYREAVFLRPPPVAETLFARPNPMQYEPFLYENQTPERRRQFRSHDLMMRVVRLQPNDMWRPVVAKDMEGYPGPVEIETRLPTRDDQGGSLITTGRADACDVVNLIVAGPNQYRFRYDHCWSGGPTSPPITLDATRPHRIAISMGALYPPAGTAISRAHPEWEALRHRIWVAVDGRDIFNEQANFYPATPSEIDFGHNGVGGTTSDPDFAWPFDRVTCLPMPTVIAAAGLPVQPQDALWQSLVAPELAGYPVAVRLRVSDPDFSTEGTLPLAVTGMHGAGDLVFLQRVDAGHARVGFDHWGKKPDYSAAFPISPGQPLDISIVSGALLPPAEAPLARQHPEWAPWRRHLMVEVNGAPALDVHWRFHPTAPEQIHFGVNPIGGSSTGRVFRGKSFAVLVEPALLK